jgi:hypothetical protein
VIDACFVLCPKMRPCAFWDFATLSAQSSQGICEGRSVTSVAKLHRKLHGYFNDIRVLSFILNGVPNCHHSIQNSELSTAAYGAKRSFADIPIRRWAFFSGGVGDRAADAVLMATRIIKRCSDLTRLRGDRDGHVHA